MTLVDLPPPATPRTPPPAEPAEGVARRVTFERADWAFYQQVLAAAGDGPQRITYDRGRLEVEVPSREHERLKSVIRRLAETYAEERGIDLYAIASTTLGREEIDGGLEADEAYLVGENARRAVEDSDDDFDPPADLAIEVDLSDPSVRKEPIYRGLGVPELWRWRGGELTCLRLTKGGRYRRVTDSVAMPGFPFALVGDLVRRQATTLEARLAAELRGWCRGLSDRALSCELK